MDASQTPGLSAQELRERLDAIVLRSAGPVALATGLLYALLAATDWLWMPAGVARVLSPLCVATSAGMLGLRAVMVRWPPSPRAGHPLVAFTGLAILVNALASQYLTGDHLQSMYVVLLLMGAGVVFLSWRWFAFEAAMLLGGWGGTVLAMGGVPSWGFYVTILLAATFLSATLLAIRLHTLSRLILLQESERRQREEVQRSNRDLEAFAHTVSHDLRAPLRSIQGFLEVLETDYAGHLGDDEKELLHRAGQGAERLELMIRDVLTYSRVGGAAAEVHPIAVREAVDAALEQLRAAIRDSGAEITVADDLPTVRADATDLVRLFQNLLGNAIKYRAPERRAGIRVGVDRRDDAWRFAVADNGVGIARDDVERIFGLFQRSGDPNDEGGFGVGLAVCRKIVARYGGRIWVDSEVGVGSTFFFTLPA